MAYKIGILHGDGIGPEIAIATHRLLEVVLEKHNIEVEFPYFPMGWEGIEKYGDPVPQVTLDGLQDCDGWVFPPHDSAAYPKEHFAKLNPSGTMRSTFDLFSNVRPAMTYPGVKSHVNEADVIVFRENTEGFMPDRNMYQGYGEYMPNKDTVLSMALFTRAGCERIAHEAFKMAMTRKKKLAIVHKANVIKWGYGLFKEVCYEVGREHYPEVSVEDYHIDAMTAHMVRRLNDFDVIVTTNLFGDILSDLACELTGSLGLGPSINTNDCQCMAQAAHGSAPDIAGRDIANPVGLMLSAQMMLDWLAAHKNDEKMSQAASTMLKAITQTMSDGVVTKDLGGEYSTTQFTDAVIETVNKI